MAADHKLELIYKKDFHEVFLEHQKDPEFGPLMVRMKVKDANGESAMDEAQWEAASVSPLNLFFTCSEPLILNVFFLLGSRYIHRFCLPENAVRFWVIFPLPPCTRFLCNYMYIILLAHGNQSQVNCLL